MANWWGKKMETQTDFIFLGSKITVRCGCSHQVERWLLLGEKKAVANLDSILESRDITLLTKVCRVKAMCSHVWMYGCTCTVVMYGCESWTIKKVKLRRIHVLELWCKRRLLRGPWTKEIKPVNPKGNHPWIFIGSTDAEAEAPRFQPSNAKSQLTGKDSRGGRDCGQEEKGVKEDEMVRWNHRLSGHEFKQTAEDSEGSLARCSPRDCKESDRAEQIQLAQFSFCTTLKQSFH